MNDRLKIPDEVKIESSCPAWWDEYPQAERSFYQSSLWGKYLEGRGDHRVFYCSCEREGMILGSLLAYLEPVAARAGRLFGLSKLYWHHGPLLSDPADFHTARVILAGLFETTGRKLLLRGFPPYIDQRQVGDLYPRLAEAFRLGLTKWATYLVDLSGGEEKAWSNLLPDARRLVNRMEEAGYEVKWLDRNSLESYRELLKTYRKAAGLDLPPLYPTEELIDLVGDKSVLLPGVYIEGKLCAVSPALAYGDSCFFFGAAQDPGLQGRERSISYLLQWNILKNGCSRGLKNYDLVGVSADPENEKEAGIRLFKSKWGGELVEYPVLEGGSVLASELLRYMKNQYRKLISK